MTELGNPVMARPDVTKLLRGAVEFLKHPALHRLAVGDHRLSKPELISLLENALVDEGSMTDLRASGGIADND